MTIQEIQEFFSQHEVPAGTQLYPGTKIEDPRLFLEVNIDVIKEWKGDLNKCPSYWHLCDLVKVIEAQHQTSDQPASDPVG